MAFPYGLTANDLHERFEEAKLIQITDDVANPTGLRDDAKIERAAIDAAGEIAMAAASKYAVPLTPLTDEVRPILIDLWAWRLIFNNRPLWLNTTDPSEDNYAWTRRRKEIVVWLRDLQAGKFTLPGVALATAASPASGGSWSQGGTNVMTRAGLLKLP